MVVSALVVGVILFLRRLYSLAQDKDIEKNPKVARHEVQMSEQRFDGKARIIKFKDLTIFEVVGKGSFGVVSKFYFRFFCNRLGDCTRRKS